MKKTSSTPRISRRRFLQSTGVAALGFPTIVPSTVFGANAPSNRITLGCIGVGRMGRGDAADFMRLKECQIVAVCDVDAKRAADGQKLVHDKYGQESASGQFKGCSVYKDFRELIARPDIDAVSIVTPDHWHALPALAAVRAGKDVFLQKPLTYTIEEGRILSDAVQRHQRILQVGSQQRSDSKFRRACELVRNGKIGELKSVEVGFGLDPAGQEEPTMPIPKNLDYDFWLGPAPLAPYTENRVHPQNGYGRPGWLRIMDYCHGMITGWGSHHMDIAHWGMDTELTGPSEIKGWTEYPKSGLWNVHGRFKIEYTYPKGVTLICAGNDMNRQGVVFRGTEGWVHVQRGEMDTHPESLLEIRESDLPLHLYRSSDHKRNFLECIKSRQQPVAPVEIGHRSNTACVLGSLSMKLGRKLTWDATRERFVNDDEANALLSRKMREPWKI